MKKEDIKDILNHTSYIVPKEAEFLFDALELRPEKGRLLELGTGLGHSTVFFSKLLPKWTIYSVDAYGAGGVEPLICGLNEGHVNNKGIDDTYNYLRLHEANNVVQIVSVFKDLLWELEVDAIFIDGTHHYEQVKADFEKFSPFLRENGLIMFDDYNNNWGVKQLVDELEGWDIKHTEQTAIIWKKH